MNIILFDARPTLLPLSDERAKHITHILRLKEGDSFRSGIINGEEFESTIVSITDDGIALENRKTRDAVPLFPLTLMLAEVRPISMRRILREAVSLGVGRIMLLISDLGEKSYLGASLYREEEYRGILLSGAMQSGMTGVSSVSVLPSLDQAIAQADGDELILLDNRAGAVSLSEAELRGRSAVLAIGPERGWSEREVGLFMEAGYRPMLLGSRILRTETAAVGGTMLALSRMGCI